MLEIKIGFPDCICGNEADISVGKIKTRKMVFWSKVWFTDSLDVLISKSNSLWNDGSLI